MGLKLCLGYGFALPSHSCGNNMARDYRNPAAPVRLRPLGLRRDT